MAGQIIERRSPQTDAAPAADTAGRSGIAITQTEQQITWFTNAARFDWILYRAFQVGIILLSGTAPVLVLFTNLPKPVQALPAALAALAAAVAAGFHWHEDAIRWAATRELLKSELRQYKTGAAHYGPDLTPVQALDAFVTRVEAIIVGELWSWQRLEQKPTSSQPNG